MRYNVLRVISYYQTSFIASKSSIDVSESAHFLLWFPLYESLPAQKNSVTEKKTLKRCIIALFYLIFVGDMQS
ncbi:hypothetical protein RO3G_08329 [Rhizopus delemar RA 99-880]|uniref:Uncharacterized protein n=1 Tax=Rhizopus delemar (strain RA 99-880 / ATCC MYA-4621 / FGSC 9543 / NRRL 43880) TaxID=246409 RepID=I1C594_RHIO9|nr:hypothetical protein RO3G_08329 [Rhizopus delemar RA 99-880]|eukprot:EIE83624.1 hypothetical protein RO3G_08329 [Rhizopus delemar RA 99-880]